MLEKNFTKKLNALAASLSFLFSGCEKPNNPLPEAKETVTSSSVSREAQTFTIGPFSSFRSCFESGVPNDKMREIVPLKQKNKNTTTSMTSEPMPGDTVAVFNCVIQDADGRQKQTTFKCHTNPDLDVVVCDTPPELLQ